MIRIAIADDHQLVVDGISALLQNNEQVHIVGTANDGSEVLKLVASTQVDVVLMDVTMPTMDGIEATRQLKQAHPDVKILVLTMFNEQAVIEQVLEAGASGYLLKNTGKKEMLEAIAKVHAGDTYFSEAVTRTIMQSMTRSRAPEPTIPPEVLTPRELDVLRLIAQEFTTQQIADTLHIAPSTVVTHRKNLHSKLNKTSAIGLVRYAMEHNIN